MAIKGCITVSYNHKNCVTMVVKLCQNNHTHPYPIPNPLIASIRLPVGMNETTDETRQRGVRKVCFVSPDRT
mgnify:CR=1 FL=1